MRKTFVTAVVALLAVLALASCDNIQTGQNGDGLVTLSVNTGDIAGNSRSITDPLAKKEANYVEVIFEGTDGLYYRANGYQGAKLKVKVPAGKYNEDNTLILIGRRSDGTLLAFGTADATGVTVGGSNPLDPTIDLTATSIVTKISAALDTNFKITVPAAFTAFSQTIIESGVLYDDAAATTCFQVPTGVVPGTYTTGIGVVLSLTNADFTTLGDRIIIPGATPIDPVTITPIDSPALTLVTGSTKPTTGDMSDGKIEFAFYTTATEGRYSITFDIPVVGYSDAYTAGTGTQPLTWHIKGGTEPNYDFGGDFAINETVPLRVTTAPTKAKFGIIVNPGH